MRFPEALKDKLSFSQQNCYLQAPVCMAVFYSHTHTHGFFGYMGPLWPEVRHILSHTQ